MSSRCRSNVRNAAECGSGAAGTRSEWSAGSAATPAAAFAGGEAQAVSARVRRASGEERCGPAVRERSGPEAERTRGAECRTGERHRLRAGYPGGGRSALALGRATNGSGRTRTDADVDVEAGDGALAWFAERAQRVMALRTGANPLAGARSYGARSTRRDGRRAS